MAFSTGTDLSLRLRVCSCWRCQQPLALARKIDFSCQKALPLSVHDTWAFSEPVKIEKAGAVANARFAF
jgi:hypothetical protein